MSYITEITDHVAKALAHVLSQFADATNLRAIIEAFAEQVQEVEDTIDDCYTERLLSTAEGVNLDQYGKILDLARNGLTDDDYRAVLLVKIMAHRGSGAIPPQLLVIATILADYLDQGVRYVPLYPAGYSLGYVLDEPTPSVSDGLRDAMVSLLEDMRPAGVSMELRETTEAEPEAEKYFTWDTDTDPQAGGFTDSPPALWNTRVLEPITDSWPFPTSGMVAVYAMADRASWVSEDPTDATAQPTWEAASMSPDGAAGLTKAEATGATYSRLGGVVERGELQHVVADAEPYKLDDSGVTWFDGEFTIHIRTRNSYDVAVDAIVAQWDPVGTGRCGLFVGSAIGVYWYEHPAGTLVTALIDNAWHDITLVRDATNVTLYVDRVQKAQAPHGDVDALNGLAPLVGARSNTNGSTTGPAFADNLDGEWSVIAVYAKAQNSTELSETWDAIDALDGVIG